MTGGVRVFGEVLQAIGSAEAGTDLVALDGGDGQCSFRVREIDSVCIDVVERAARWWVCSSSAGTGPRMVDSAYAYPGRSIDGFIAAVRAAAKWDGEGDPDGWDQAHGQGRWRRDPCVIPPEQPMCTTVGELVVTTSLLTVPHESLAAAPQTHEVVLRHRDDVEVMMSRRCSAAEARDAHAVAVATARRLLGIPAPTAVGSGAST